MRGILAASLCLVALVAGAQQVNVGPVLFGIELPRQRTDGAALPLAEIGEVRLGIGCDTTPTQVAAWPVDEEFVATPFSSNGTFSLCTQIVDTDNNASVWGPIVNILVALEVAPPEPGTILNVLFTCPDGTPADVEVVAPDQIRVTGCG